MVTQLQTRRDTTYWGVVGLGMMGGIGSHSINHAGGRVNAIFGETREQTRNFLADTEQVRLPEITDGRGYAGTFENYGGLITGVVTPFQVAYLPIPNYMHVNFGKRSAKAGLHILMEKPLATNVEDAEEFQDTALEAGVAVQINSQYRFHNVLNHGLRSLINGTCEDKDLLAKCNGNPGQPKKLRGRYRQGWMAGQDDPIGWRPEYAVAGGTYGENGSRGKLTGDLGVHNIITTIDLFDVLSFVQFEGQTYILHETRFRPKERTKSFAKVPPRSEVPEKWEEMNMRSGQFLGDDLAAASFVMRTRSGLHIPGTFELSQVEKNPQDKYDNSPFGNDFVYEVEFDKCIVTWDQWNENRLKITDTDGSNVRFYERKGGAGMTERPPRHNQGYDTAMVEEVNEMQGIIERNDPVEIENYTRKNVGMGVQAQKILDKWNEKELLPAAEYKEPQMIAV